MRASHAFSFSGRGGGRRGGCCGLDIRRDALRGGERHAARAAAADHTVPAAS
jgi:hypothetical protein